MNRLTFVSRARPVARPTHHRRARRMPWLFIVSAVILLVASACGSGSGAGSASGSGSSGQSKAASGGLTHVDVGIIPIGGAAPLKLGIKKGFFKDAGLDVTTHIAKGGAALVPAVASGQYQFSFSNNVSLLIARSKGLPIEIVAMADGAGKDPDPGDEAIIVPKNSPIHNIADLKGKKIATNTLDNIVQLAAMVTLKKHGIDPFSAHFVEVGFPDMIPALSQHRVDAAAINEPFLSKAKSEGYRTITNAYRQVQQGLFPSSWFTTSKYVSQHKKVVSEFQKAMFRSNKYAQSHPKEVRAILPTYTKISPDAVKSINLPHWEPAAPPKSMLDLIANYSVEFKFIQKKPDVAAMLPNLGNGS